MRAKEARKLRGARGARAAVLGLVALGIVACSVALPAAAAGNDAYRDDNSNGRCPGSYILRGIGASNWDVLEMYDLNGDAIVCQRSA